MAENDVSRQTAQKLAQTRQHREQLIAEQQEYADRTSMVAWYADQIAEDKRQIEQLELFAQYEQYGIPAGCLVEVRHNNRVQLRGLSKGTDQPEGYNHSFVCFKWMPTDEPPDTRWSEARSRCEVSVIRDADWVLAQLDGDVVMLDILLALTDETNRMARSRDFYEALKRIDKVMREADPDAAQPYGNLVRMMDPQRTVVK